jgi:hypothetical protein
MRKRQTEHLPFIPGSLSSSPHPMLHLPHQHPGPNLSSNTNASPSWKRLNERGGGCRLQFKKELERFRVQHHPIVGTMIGAHHLFASSTPAASHAVEFGTVHGGMDICTSYVKKLGQGREWAAKSVIVAYAQKVLNKGLSHRRSSSCSTNLFLYSGPGDPGSAQDAPARAPVRLEELSLAWGRHPPIQGRHSPLGPWLTRLTRDVPDAEDSPLLGDERLRRSWRCSAWAR